MEQIFSQQINPNLDMVELDACLQEFRNDYNQKHFVRNETFKVCGEGARARASAPIPAAPRRAAAVRLRPPPPPPAALTPPLNPQAAADAITGPTRKIFIEFLERSCTAEFSGFLLYKELGRRLKVGASGADGVWGPRGEGWGGGGEGGALLVGACALPGQEG
jgi:magnesium-protoporphyrin IX monomethyl ester (oxidative) cyclase